MERITSVIRGMNHSQREALADILDDMEASKKKGQARTRIVYGEVGAGKTWVALAAAHYCQTVLGGQTALMCPTTSLARQHYETANRIRGRDPDEDRFGDLAIVLSRQTKAERQRFREERAEKRKSGLVIGTQALVNLRFPNLKLVIVDEQQKFGTKAREQMSAKTRPAGSGLTLLLTATPIPQTVGKLATTDEIAVSCIDPRKKQRKAVQTTVLHGPRDPKTTETVMRLVQKHSVRNRGITFLVAPCICADDPKLVDCLWLVETVLADSAPRRYGISADQVSVLHGRMSAREKEEAVQEIRTGKTNILITTSIIEVGMHVEGANLVVIYQCDRFGVAQIHQIRGRVGRRLDDLPRAQCVLVAPAPGLMSDKTRQRTEAVTRNEGKTEGMELAVEDAVIRGPGQAEGTEQHGYPEHGKPPEVPDLDKI